MLRKIPISALVMLFVALLVFTSASSIAVGPMNITIADSFKSLFPSAFTLPDHIKIVINEIRLPRTLMCIIIGAILALCGAVMQGLFRNPLAEPGIIGVSAGAMLGAAIAMVLFASWLEEAATIISLFAVPIFAFIGGLIATMIVYRLGTSKFGTSVTIMLLAGIAISALSGAGIGYLNFAADDQALRDLSLWSMGSLAGATWSGIGLGSITLLLLYITFRREAMPLNAMLLGESEAAHMGVNVQSFKRRLIVLSAIGVGVAVSLTGVIGFIGLIVPHLIRMLVGPDHRGLLPLSALFGALILTGSDMIARVAVAPAELPVGIVTALIGTPFFLLILIQQRGKMI
ncbi:Hemin transport system permease protein hmuU [Vibrio nigripulchritudo MADA3029]|uniref:Hemin transport system permease protein hmuU n=2 Tax=Vibrio nigripulchritudo TaxID=28173 RepID=U4K737_9VIBR|nr:MULTISPECIES: iron ABC transporter permease [Vibrio]KJY81173.1 iron ABC transporter permease [Vibrio nigripulchritudo]UAB69337.1 iron ABC transporter permease [Vibrio sp. SCSIO 43132]CCN48276.1 Hemin transport system permease protein hmuU [Vibrio nigripulchritudo MADA3020]CCN54898.1 Hemin transport system permease protein hmuU [Vibrio nigripulchritudo MADA3021]CCN58227.1 Hemin transport system permease protein hmuU [Vibrio nigripulchritudo MADA3029]